MSRISEVGKVILQGAWIATSRRTWLEGITISGITVCVISACQEPGGSAVRASLATSVAETAWSIGVAEGQQEYQFGDVRSVAVDGMDRVYVADRMGSVVRVYDGESGGFLRAIGREGEGPGEYRSPSEINVDADGRIYVRDARRVTVLVARIAGEIPDSVVVTWPVPGFGNELPTRSGFDTAGTYYYPQSVFRGVGPPAHLFLAYSAAGPTGDTLPVPRYSTSTAGGIAVYSIGDGNMRIAEGLSHAPFEPVASWSATRRGTVLSGDGVRYVIYETNASGDTVATLHGPSADARPIPVEERAESLAALERRLSELPVPLPQVSGVSDAVAQRRLPDRVPAYLAIHVGSDGKIWVEQWPEQGESRSRPFDVFGRDGDLLGRVVLPLPITNDPPAFFTERAVYGIVRDRETDIARVVKFLYIIPER